MAVNGEIQTAEDGRMVGGVPLEAGSGWTTKGLCTELCSEPESARQERCGRMGRIEVTISGVVPGGGVTASEPGSGDGRAGVPLMGSWERYCGVPDPEGLPKGTMGGRP